MLAQVGIGGGGAQGPGTSSGGASFRNGTVAPSSIVGTNGDFYLNTSTECLYGPKANGAWPAVCVLLIGQPGAPGPPLGYVAENTANKGVAGGYAPLNSLAQIPLTNLPVIPYAQIGGAPLALGFIPLNPANNLGDLSNPATARSNLGLVVGTNIEAHSVLLDGFAGLAGSGIVAVSGGSATSGVLSGDVTTNGLAATVNSVGGSTAAHLHSAEVLANAATSNNTNSTIVMRDPAGNVNATQVFAGGTAVENTANKGKANGYAPLDGSGLLPAANLPTSAMTAAAINSGTLSASFANLSASSMISASATGAGAFMMTAGAAQTPPANTVGLQAPPSVPASFNCTWWGVPTTGLIHATATTPCILSPSLVDLAADTNATLLPVANLPAIPYVNLPNPKVTAGAGGVTGGYLVARDTSSPTRYVATSTGGCGSGFAASTAAAGATFQLYSMPGTLIAAVADNTVTAGDVVVGGSVIPGRVADSGFTSRSSVSSTTCVVGIAQASAVAGGTFNVLFDGTGTYGTQVSSSSVVAGLGYTPAPSVSPAFTGVPTAPTQTAGDASLAIATDAFVAAAASAATGVTTISNNFFGPAGVANKTVAYIGNSTVWQDTGWFDTMCKQTVANGVFAGMACFSANSVSVDASNNVTVTICGATTACTNTINYGTAPFALTIGKFASFETADSSIGACSASFPVASSTSSAYVFNNAACGAAVLAAAGAINTPYTPAGTTTISPQILNFGVNGGTLASALANTSPTGMGIGGVLAANPDLAIMRGYGINDVRLGACNLACLEAEQKSWIDQLRFNNPKISQILIAENSLTNNAGCSAYITPTTSAQAYSQILEQATMSWTGYPTVITLDTQKTIYGSVSPTSSGVATLVLNAGGSAYAVNDILTLATSGATLKVLTVSSGAIVTFQLLTPGSSAIVANGVTSTDSGSGTGATFNVTVLTTDPYMAALPTGCLHPSTIGHAAEALQDVQFLTNLAYNAGAQTIPFSPFYANWTAASSYLAQYCRSTNYAAPWSVPGCANGWADPLYYTLIGSGTAAAQAAGATFLSIAWPGPAAPPNVAQAFDVIQLQDGNTYQLPANSTTAYSGNFSPGVARTTFGSGALTYPTMAGEKLNVLRPALPQQACEAYFNNIVGFPYRRRFYVPTGGGGTNFIDVVFLPNEGLNAPVSNIPTYGTGDVLCLSSGAVIPLTSATFTTHSSNTLQVNVTGSFASYVGSWGIIFGSQPTEGQPDVNGKVAVQTVALQLGGIYQITHGTNATAGVVTLTSGTATVNTTAITALAAPGAAGAVVVLASQSCSSCGSLSIGTVTAGTSFVINSTNASDASKVYWEIKGLN